MRKIAEASAKAGGSCKRFEGSGLMVMRASPAGRTCPLFSIDRLCAVVQNGEAQ